MAPSEAFPQARSPNTLGEPTRGTPAKKSPIRATKSLFKPKADAALLPAAAVPEPDAAPAASPAPREEIEVFSERGVLQKSRGATPAAHKAEGRAAAAAGPTTPGAEKYTDEEWREWEETQEWEEGELAEWTATKEWTDEEWEQWEELEE